MAEAVVARAFVRIVEDLERFGRFLEAFDRFLVAGVLVRMVLDGEPPIGRSDLAVTRGARDAQHFVIVALGGHGGHEYPRNRATVGRRV